MSTPSKHRTKLFAALMAAALGGAFAPLPASADEADMIRRIDALQKEIDSLRAQMVEAQKKAEAATTEAAKKADAASEAAKKAEAKATPPATRRGGALAFSETSGITIYGKIELIEEATSDGKDMRHALGSNSSRIGFKGVLALTDNLSGVMQIETGISPDDAANSKQFANRNSYIGLTDKRYGTFVMGTYDMPAKTLEGFAQPMYGSGDELEIIIHGKGTRVAANTAASPWFSIHTRQTNVFQYWSPRFKNLQAKLAYAADEQQTITAYTKPVSGASLEYFDGTYQAGIAYEKQKNFAALGADMTGLKATLGARFGDATIGGAYSKLNNHLGKATSNYVLSGTYRLSPVVLKGSFGKSSATSSGAQDGLSMNGLQLDYPFDRNTTLFTYWLQIKNDAKAQGQFEALDVKYKPLPGNDPHIFGIGLRYDF